MTVRRDQMAEVGSHGFHPYFCRGAELEDILTAIEGEDCRAVFVRYDTGLGASSVLRELAVQLGKRGPVLSVHGTPSLSAVPYGALAPFLHELSLDDVSVRMNVLRGMLSALDRQRSPLIPGDPATPVIIIDDAHAIDPSTADLLVGLALSGTVRVVASHLRSKTMPHSLPKLWSSGMAESIELYPLTREQGHEFCVAMLGGPVLPAISWYLWSSSGGNVLLLRLLIEEAVTEGRVQVRDGLWVYRRGVAVSNVSRSLGEVVSQQIRGLSAAAETTLHLVALAEPIALETANEIGGADTVRELRDRELVKEQAAEPGMLRLVNPIYGDVIRHMVTPTQSRVLYERLIERLDADPASSESLLRRVTWAVDSGLDVSEEQLLQAAIFACKLVQPVVALHLLERIRKGPNAFRARVVRARAKYTLAEYQDAAELLDGGFDEATNLADLMFGSLLGAITRSALGMPVSSIENDAVHLRAAGERLVMVTPADADMIREHVQANSNLLELMVLSQTGDYRRMPPLIDSILENGAGLQDEEYKLNKSFALAMDSERLCAQGFPDQGFKRAMEAFAIEHSADHDVFFLPEMIIFRQLCAALTSGDLSVAGQLLDTFSVDTGPVVMVFGGGATVARGMGFIRQGQLEKALEVMLPGIESLSMNDPQQLLGFCTAMVVYASARVGETKRAADLLDGYLERPGLFLVTAHERAFLAAGREYLLHDGGGLAALNDLATAARNEESALLELNALSLAVELGDTSALVRLTELAAVVEGPWAAALLRFGQEQLSPTPTKGLKAARRSVKERTADLSSMEWYSNTAFDADGFHLQPGDARSARRVPEAGLSGEPNGSTFMQPAAALAKVKLTRREREITTLAISGHTDREIAQELHLSVRTVEGHLYRCYSKLGISGRDDLPARLPSQQ
ncbi:LuxR family transcriptional regulator [Arthrobacter sp. GMC3]|uniref:helix-turn-helix transcriptional regulator n=1 Tax=Arthrobacter sp. GMC3 TaxID=2058894 RepID=UPI000CE4E392|nr:LuxR family transcriptional regulator [Arthrobacter sp. GMC3]